MNNSPDEDDEDESVVDGGPGPGGDAPSSDSVPQSPETEDGGGAMAIISPQAAGASAAVGGLAEVSPPSVLPPHALQIDVGTDAIQADQIRSMYDVQLRGGEETAATASARSQLGPRHRNSYDSLNNGDEEETGSASAAAGHQVSKRLIHRNEYKIS